MLRWPHQWCDDGEVTDPMAALDAALKRIERAEQIAEDIINAAYLDLGRAIRQARDSGTKQIDIARHLKREPEHIRRIQEDADVVDGLKPAPSRKTRPAPKLPRNEIERLLDKQDD